MTCVGLVQHLEGEAMKKSVLKPGFEGSADRDFTEALVQKQFRVAEFDVSLIGWGGVLCVPGMSGGPPLSLPAVQRHPRRTTLVPES